jgi:hypothetical protein
MWAAKVAMPLELAVLREAVASMVAVAEVLRGDLLGVAVALPMCG